MPRYRYTATDPVGRRFSDELEAASREQAASQLELLGLKLESLAPAEDTAANGSDPERDRGRLSDRNVVEFARHVAALDQANLPLPSSLRALGEELATGPLRRVLARVSDRLEAGDSLNDAIEAEGRRFPAHLRGLVASGVRTGRLGEVLEEFTHYFHIAVELRRRLVLSLAYPIMLIMVTACIYFFLSYWIITEFVKIYADFGMNLPVLTMVVISMSRVVTDSGTLLLLAVIGAVVFAWLLGMVGGAGRWRRSLSSQLPLLGPLLRWTALVEFSHLLALLLESDVPLPEALRLTGEGLRDADIATACDSMRRQVEDGSSLADSIGRLPQFPAGLARTLRWAERHQSLPGALHLAGDMFEARARAQAKFIGVVCTTLTVLLVLMGIGIIVLGLFLPLIQLIARLSG